jgi:DNA-binding NtrC family response regulator
MRILVIDDDEPTRDSLRGLLIDEGHTVRTAGSGHRGVKELERAQWDLALVDVALPDMDGLALLWQMRLAYPRVAVVAMVDPETASRATAAREAGACALIRKPDDVTPHTILRLVHDVALAPKRPHSCLIGTSPATRELRQAIARVARARANVLIIGESGTGKELVAEAIHGASARTEGRLVKVGGATWSRPEDLVEAIQRASRGSLFLDEIADIPMELQLRLRLILEDAKLPDDEGQVEPMDVRVISSTRLDPDTAVRDGRLRADLCYRLGVLIVRVPPLRERLGDLPLLCDHFLTNFSDKYRRPAARIGPGTYEALVRHPWPGNVRELENAIERALLVAQGREITIADLPEEVTTGRSAPNPGMAAPLVSQPVPQKLTLDAGEREAILTALQTTHWNKRAAAAILGLHRPTLYAKMHKHGIPTRPSSP